MYTFLYALIQWLVMKVMNLTLEVFKSSICVKTLGSVSFTKGDLLWSLLICIKFYLSKGLYYGNLKVLLCKSFTSHRINWNIHRTIAHILSKRSFVQTHCNHEWKWTFQNPILETHLIETWCWIETKHLSKTRAELTTSNAVDQEI